MKASIVLPGLLVVESQTENVLAGLTSFAGGKHEFSADTTSGVSQIAVIGQSNVQERAGYVAFVKGMAWLSANS